MSSVYYKYTLLQFVASDSADAKPSRAHMGADAGSQRKIHHFHIREAVGQLFFERLQFLWLHRSIGKAYFQFPCLMERREAGVDVVFQSVQHTLESRFHAAGFGVGFQFASLDGENGFYSENCAKSGCGSGDPAAFFQIFKGIHRDIDRGVQSFRFQDLFYFGSGPAPVCQDLCVQHGDCLGDGDAVIIYNVDSPAVRLIVCQDERGLACIAQSR